MTEKQLRAKVDRLTERIVKSQNQLDAWRMERKELKLKLSDVKKTPSRSSAKAKVRVRAK